MSLAPNTTASSNRRLGRSRSHKDLSLLQDGYSVRSSYLVMKRLFSIDIYISGVPIAFQK